MLKIEGTRTGLTLSLPVKYKALLRTIAGKQQRSVNSLLTEIVTRELQRNGLVDTEGKPTIEVEVL